MIDTQNHDGQMKQVKPATEEKKIEVEAKDAASTKEPTDTK